MVILFIVPLHIILTKKKNSKGYKASIPNLASSNYIGIVISKILKKTG